MSTEASNLSMTSNGQTFRWQSVFLGYGVVMFLILLFGFFGNLFTILVLRQREHRNKSITPLMLNLAIADLIIVVFGYPAIINTNMNGELMRAGSPLCSWSGFINGTTGLTSIATLTSMSGVVYQTIKKNTPNYTVSSRQHAVLIVGAWFYGLTAMLPPLLGWNRFVPGKAGFSCAPDWSAHDNASVVYIAVLITAGFLVPLMLIAMFLILTHRLLKRLHVPGDPFILAQRRKYQKRTLFMATATIVAFLLSWSPYCIVSFAATIKGQHVLTTGEAEIPELMAKASVIYNPIVYTIMNERFRRTLWGIITGNRPDVAPDEAGNVTEHFAVSASRNTGRDNLAIPIPVEISANIIANRST